MKHLKRIPVLVLLLVCFLCFADPNAARAATVVTSLSAFTADLAPGYYLETFSGLTGGGTTLPVSISFTGGTGNAFSYNAVDDSGHGLFALPLFGTPSELSTSFFGATVQFNFLSGNVAAVGGNFFSTDTEGNPDGGTITLNLSDGTHATIPTSSLSSFVGFLSPGVFITNLQVVPGADSYATVANFYVGGYAAPVGSVPEPATFGLLAGGLIAGGLLRKRLSRV
jgi:hypothetical protein